MDSTLVPFDLARYFTPDDLRRGISWTKTANTTTYAELLIEVLLLWQLSLGSLGRQLWPRFSARLTRPQPSPLDRILGPDWRAAALYLSLAGVLPSLVIFPLGLYTYYFEAHRIGLSVETLTSFVGRAAMRTVLTAIVFASLGAVLPAIRRRWPRRWWIALGAATASLLVVGVAIAPLLQHIDYQVRPLEAGPLRRRIEALLVRQHADVGEIMTINESRYGTESNAFVTGFGPTRRLILTDTLIQFGDEAVMGAVAHEIGHRRDQRLSGRLVFSGLGMLALLALVELTLRVAARRGAPHEAHGLVLVMLVVTLLKPALSPIRDAFNRDEEREADTLELSIRHDYDAYIDEQVRFVRSFAADPQPSVFVRMMMSHPTSAERISRALWYKQHASGPVQQAAPRP